MVEVELALAASARAWADDLHRFLADHGGARVRTVIMGADEVVSEQYDVLVIDDVCSFLTPRLVERARRHGRLVIGVFESADGADAKRRLLECNVDDVIEAEATPDEFVAVVRRVQRLAPVTRVPTTPRVGGERPASGRLVVVGSPPGGSGATEVAVTLASVVGGVLVDADDVAPSIAQRLGVPLHPNLRTAIDLVHHRSEPVEEVVHTVAGVQLVAGLASGDDWAQLHAGEVEAVLEELATRHDPVIVNVSAGIEPPQRGEGRFGLARGIIGRGDIVMAVGSPTPVGVTRLVRWVQEAVALAPHAGFVALLNQARRSPFQRAEVAAEVERALGGVPFEFLPHDVRVAEAAWTGGVPGRGPFRRAVARAAAAAGL